MYRVQKTSAKAKKRKKSRFMNSIGQLRAADVAVATISFTTLLIAYGIIICATAAKVCAMKIMDRPPIFGRMTGDRNPHILGVASLQLGIFAVCLIVIMCLHF